MHADELFPHGQVPTTETDLHPSNVINSWSTHTIKWLKWNIWHGHTAADNLIWTRCIRFQLTSFLSPVTILAFILICRYSVGAHSSHSALSGSVCPLRQKLDSLMVRSDSFNVTLVKGNSSSGHPDSCDSDICPQWVSVNLHIKGFMKLNSRFRDKWWEIMGII